MQIHKYLISRSSAVVLYLSYLDMSILTLAPYGFKRKQKPKSCTLKLIKILIHSVLGVDYPNGDHYEGYFRNNEKNGNGTLILDNGTKYVGQFKDGYFHGKGTMLWTSGERYEGIFKKGEKTKDGVYYFPDGTKYVGTFKGDLFNGEGVMTWKNGDRYEGTFVNGQRAGSAIYTFANGRKYVGKFKEGKFNGNGVQSWPNGDRYEGIFKGGEKTEDGVYFFLDGMTYVGTFKGDLFNGQGIMIWNTGDWYNGTFVNGERMGNGTYTFADGRKYVGEFNNGQFHGKGVQTWPNGDRFEGIFRNGEKTKDGVYYLPYGIKYMGEYKNGRFDGQGVQTWPSGGRYEGSFVDGEITGNGTYTFADGGKYVGEFNNGLFHGKGVQTWPDGNRFEGIFKNDEKTKDGVYYLPDGRKYVGEYKNGRLEGQGIMTWTNGDRGEKYVGEFKNDQINGRGVQTWPNGDRYEGVFINGEKTKNGVYYFPNGAEYVGPYNNNGRFDGQGIMTWTNGDRYEVEKNMLVSLRMVNSTEKVCRHGQVVIALLAMVMQSSVLFGMATGTDLKRFSFQIQTSLQAVGETTRNYYELMKKSFLHLLANKAHLFAHCKLCRTPSSISSFFSTSAPLQTSSSSSNDRSILDKIADELRHAKHVLAITGAGISADSGLPTYRGIGGLYSDGKETDDGMAIEDALSGPTMRRRPDICWKYIHQIELACRAAKPNAAHETLVAFESKFPHFAVLTQNIDGLHRVAGSKNLIEIHGNIQQLFCTSCGHDIYVNSFEGMKIPPKCQRCGSLVRPRVVLFGEMLPIRAITQLHEFMSKGLDAVISIGTTSVFPYIAKPVVDAARNNAVTIEINPGETEVSDVVRYRLRERAAIVLPELLKRLS
ncbi:unnamed protein product [Adineta ricciae]|uniref:Deacetylase sirtuin-type domain-containing protein n=1 Tax=Adineta ricciae TaxID=249248 RepID=A0A815QF35_ADIRI|nr:unnamed protein product [Adineta ricciae]